MKRWILCLLIGLALVGTAHAGKVRAGKVRAAKKPAAAKKPPAVHPYMQGLDLFLRQAPNFVRQGAELYCLRLEFIGHLYRKDRRDAAVDESLENLGRTVRNLGMAGLDSVVAIREKIPHGKMMRMINGWRKKKGGPRGKGKARPGAARDRTNAVARRVGQKIGRGIRQRISRIGMLRRQVTQMIRNLHLTEKQRQELKLEAVTAMPAVFRGGAAIVADGMELGRKLIAKELPVKDCAERIVRISDEVKTVATAAIDLAFTLKGKLSKEQQKSWMANIPLRLIFFR